MIVTVKSGVIADEILKLDRFADYYQGKISDFLPNNFKESDKSIPTPLRNVLGDITKSYRAISDNLKSLSSYLSKFHDDVVYLENVMSGTSSGSYYNFTSDAQRSVSKYSNSIDAFSISYDRIFKNVDQAVFEKSKLTAKLDIDLSKYDLDAETAQALLIESDPNKIYSQNELQFLTDYYNNYYTTCIQQQTLNLSFAEAEYNRLLALDYYSLTEAISNTDNTAKIKALQQQLADTGFSSASEYEAALQKAKNDYDMQYATLHSLEQASLNVKYMFDMHSKDYLNFKSNVTINDSDIQSIIQRTSSGEVASISYKQYCKKFGDVDIFTFQNAVTRKYGNTITITDMDNKEIDDLINVAEIDPDIGKYYTYLYQTKGKDVAYAYLDDTKDQLHMKSAEKNAAELLDSLADLNDEESRLKAITNHLGVTLVGLGHGMASSGENTLYALEGLLTKNENRTYSTLEYESMFILQALAPTQAKLENGLISESSNGKYVSMSSMIDYSADYGKLLDHNYQISQSIGNMIPSIMASYVYPPIGQVAFGLSAGGGSYHSAMIEGYTKGQSLLYGAVSGASEVLMEKVLGGIPLLSDVDVISFKTLLQASLKEANEEFVQTFVDAKFENVILKKDINGKEVFQEAIQSAIYGGITGGIMNLPSFVINSSNIKTIQNQINSGNISESQFVDAMHDLIPETRNMDYKQIIEEYSGSGKGVALTLTTLNGKDISRGGISSLLSGLGVLGIGSNIFGNNHTSNEGSAGSQSTSTTTNSQRSTEQLESQKQRILNDNPGLASLNERALNGETVQVPSHLSEAFLELRTIDAEIRNIQRSDVSSSTNTIISRFASSVLGLSLFQDVISNTHVANDSSVSNSYFSQVLEQFKDLFKKVSEEVVEEAAENTVSDAVKSFASGFQNGNINTKNISDIEFQSVNGIGSNLNSSLSQLEMQRQNLLNANPELISLNERALNGETIQVPSHLSEAFLEFRTIDAEIRNIQKSDVFSNTNAVVSKIDSLVSSALDLPSFQNRTSNIHVANDSSVSTSYYSNVSEQNTKFQFKDLPASTRAFISQIAEGSDYYALKAISESFIAGYQSGDIDTKNIISNIDLIGEQLKLFAVDSLTPGSASFINQDSLFQNQKLLVTSDVNSSFETTAHELGHMLLNVVENVSVPAEFESVMDSVRQSFLNDPSKVESFLEEARAYKESLWSKMVQETDEYVQFKIDYLLEHQTELIEELKNAAVSETEITRIINENDTVAVKNILEKYFGNAYIDNNFYSLVDNDPTMHIYDTVCGFIDSIYNGNNPYYSSFYDNGFLRSHTSDYFSKNIARSFDEQFADFTSMKLFNLKAVESITSELFGQDWMNMMNKSYHDIATKMENRQISYDVNIQQAYLESLKNLSTTNRSYIESNGIDSDLDSSLSQLETKRSRLLNDNPGLASLNERALNGETVQVPSHLSDAFLELRTIDAMIRDAKDSSVNVEMNELSSSQNNNLFSSTMDSFYSLKNAISQTLKNVDQNFSYTLESFATKFQNHIENTLAKVGYDVTSFLINVLDLKVSEDENHIANNISSFNQLSQLEIQRQNLLNANPELISLNERALKGETVQVPSHLSDAFLELRTIEGKINNIKSSTSTDTSSLDTSSVSLAPYLGCEDISVTALDFETKKSEVIKYNLLELQEKLDRISIDDISRNYNLWDSSLKDMDTSIIQAYAQINQLLYQYFDYKDIVNIFSDEMLEKLQLFEDLQTKLQNASDEVLQSNPASISSYGVDQGFVQVSKESYSEKYNNFFQMVHEKFPSMSLNNVRKFLDSINNPAGICGYAAQINSLVSYILNYGSQTDLSLILDANCDVRYEELLLKFFMSVNQDNKDVVYFDKKTNAFVTSDTFVPENISSFDQFFSKINRFLKEEGFSLQVDSFELFNNENRGEMTDFEEQQLKDSIRSSLMNGDSVQMAIFNYKDDTYHFYDPYNPQNDFVSKGVRKGLSNGHQITVTGMNLDGDLIISSWGQRFILKFEDLRTNKMFIHSFKWKAGDS